MRKRRISVVSETVPPDRPRKAGRSLPGGPGGRTYPRTIAEAGAVAGDRRAVGLRALARLDGALADLREAALADLGGEANVSALCAEVLEIGLPAELLAAP